MLNFVQFFVDLSKHQYNQVPSVAILICIQHLSSWICDNSLLPCFRAHVAS